MFMIWWNMILFDVYDFMTQWDMTRSLVVENDNRVVLPKSNTITQNSQNQDKMKFQWL